MNERERAVNRDLGLLDEAHYEGRIARAEYRVRRRNVLAGLRGSDGVTARKTLAQPPAGAGRGPAAGDDLLPTLLGRGAPAQRVLLAVFAAGALVCAVLLGLLLFMN